MKIITPQQIDAILGAVYQTNITAIQFDAMKKFLSELPDYTDPLEVPKAPTPPTVPTPPTQTKQSK